MKVTVKNKNDYKITYEKVHVEKLGSVYNQTMIPNPPRIRFLYRKRIHGGVNPPGVP